jgi:hypothetical protein
MKVQTDDGKKTVKTMKCFPDLGEADVSELTVVCKRMKQRTQHAPVEIKAEAEEVEVGGGGGGGGGGGIR